MAEFSQDDPDLGGRSKPPAQAIGASFWLGGSQLVRKRILAGAEAAIRVPRTEITARKTPRLASQPDIEKRFEENVARGATMAVLKGLPPCRATAVARHCSRASLADGAGNA